MKTDRLTKIISTIIIPTTTHSQTLSCNPPTAAMTEQSLNPTMSETPEPSSPLSLPPSPPPHPPRAPTTPVHSQSLQLWPSDTSFEPSPRRTKAEIAAINRKAGQATRLAKLAERKAARATTAATAREIRDIAEEPPLPALLLDLSDLPARSHRNAHASHNSSTPEAAACEELPYWDDIEDDGPIRESQDHVNEDERPSLEDIAKRVFTLLYSYKLLWGAFVEYVSDPDSSLGRRRWYGFFKDEPCVNRVLNHWTSSRNRKGRHCVRRWAVQYVSKLVDREGGKVTGAGVLRARNKPVNESFVLGFDLEKLRETLSEICPTMAGLIRTFSTTRRQ